MAVRRPLRLADARAGDEAVDEKIGGRRPLENICGKSGGKRGTEEIGGKSRKRGETKIGN